MLSRPRAGCPGPVRRRRPPKRTAPRSPANWSNTSAWRRAKSTGSITSSRNSSRPSGPRVDHPSFLWPTRPTGSNPSHQIRLPRRWAECLPTEALRTDRGRGRVGGVGGRCHHLFVAAARAPRCVALTPGFPLPIAGTVAARKGREADHRASSAPPTARFLPPGEGVGVPRSLRDFANLYPCATICSVHRRCPDAGACHGHAPPMGTPGLATVMQQGPQSQREAARQAAAS